ncbi:MAG: hypothetical protein V7L29_23885 [Nostoc sp.]|uniref:hypothetical protein n=1 Tax=Nostoc sp. TaxID=1180 RepID=UPI002FEEB6AD
MQSTQISSMFMFITETEEASVCGGESTVISSGVYDGVVKTKGSPGKPGVKKQTVESTSSTSSTKVVKIINKGKIPQKEVLDLLSSISSILKLDFF